MTSAVELSVPGKTFLIGEYLAVKGGPSLVMTTGPRFSLKVRGRAEGEVPYMGFHEKSPAGLWYEKTAATFSGSHLEFHDPHGGVGGLGASSAQFALVYVAELFLRDGKLDSSHLQWEKVLRDYRSVAWTGEGEPPSGADVVAQLCGGITHYDGAKFRANVHEWPFLNSAVMLLHTGQKLATHDYLKGTLTVPQGWQEIVVKADLALREVSFPHFAEAFIQYGKQLAKQGWVAQGTRDLLEALRTADLEGVNIVAAKGCGAMGADIVAVLMHLSPTSDPRQALEQWLASRPEFGKVKIVGSSSDIGAGLQVS